MNMTITAGGVTYTVDFGEWAIGSPQAVAAAGGGAGPVLSGHIVQG